MTRLQVLRKLSKWCTVSRLVRSD